MALSPAAFCGNKQEAQDLTHEAFCRALTAGAPKR